MGLSHQISTRISQGDIYRDTKHIEYVHEEGDTLEVSFINFPLVIVLTQDCDLEQDPRNCSDSKIDHDKCLISVLVAPIYNYDHFLLGTHLSEIGQQMQVFPKGKTPEEYIKQNRNNRYHYLEFQPELQLPIGIIDFKHYFSTNLKTLTTLRKSHYICTVSPLYREDISIRFANFLSRIGLPDVSTRNKTS